MRNLILVVLVGAAVLYQTPTHAASAPHGALPLEAIRKHQAAK